MKICNAHIMIQAIPRLMDPIDGEKAAHEMAKLTNNTSASEDTAAARAGALQVCDRQSLFSMC